MRARSSFSPHHGWLLVVIAAVAQNCAIGLNFAAYGTMIGALEARYGTSRALIASGPGAFVLSLSLCSPLVGGLLQRASVRTVMMAALYGLLIGPGACLLGIVPAATLVGNWFVRDRGKALGLINMPILLLVMPPLFGLMLPRIGVNGVFLTIAAIYLVILLPLLGIIDRPDMIGQTARGAEDGAGAASASETAPLTKRQLLAMPRFWMLSIAVGLLTSGGTMIVVHFVPFGLGRGFSLSQAALLISAFGGAGMVGALFFGWLVDRIGAVNTLIINALAQALLWLGLFPALGLPLMLTLAGSFGACAGAIIAIHGAAINELFGRQSFSQAMGLSYLLKLPFIVGSAPLAGWLFDRTDNYLTAFGLQIIAFVAAALIFVKLGRSKAPAAILAAPSLSH